MDDLGTRIKLASERVGGLDRLAELIPAMSRRSLSDYVSSKSEPRAKLIGEIAEKTGVSAGWLLVGEGDIDGGSTAGRLRHIVERISDAADRRGFSGEAFDMPGMVALPRYEDVQASAGPGFVAPIAQAAETMVAFDRRFLRDKGATPDQCTVITARGDSMSPTIPDGSLLVVDHSQTQISNGFIMVINLGDDLLVKRVRRRLDGLVDLISDNHAYAPETVGPDMLQQLRVVGRVVYFCRAP